MSAAQAADDVETFEAAYNAATRAATVAAAHMLSAPFDAEPARAAYRAAMHRGSAAYHDLQAAKHRRAAADYDQQAGQAVTPPGESH